MKRHYVGLVNQGNTCYLNSIVQALFMTPEFRNTLYDWKYVERHEGGEVNFNDKKEDENKTNEIYRSMFSETTSVPLQLQRLFVILQTSDASAVQTTELTKSLGWDSSRATYQEDAQDFLNNLLHTLKNHFQYSSTHSDFIDNLFRGSYIYYTKCLECESVTTSIEDFLQLPVPVNADIKCAKGNLLKERNFEDTGNLYHALREIVKEEALPGPSKPVQNVSATKFSKKDEEGFSCDKCNKKTKALRKQSIAELPYILTLHLKRFGYIKKKGRYKINDKMEFPMTLDLKEFMLMQNDNSFVVQEKNSDTSSNLEYALFAVVVHSGQVDDGHYYALIKDFTSKQWFCFNDVSVKSISLMEIRSKFGGKKTRSNAYLLMYRKVDLSANQLCRVDIALSLNLEDSPPNHGPHNSLARNENTIPVKENTSEMIRRDDVDSEMCKNSGVQTIAKILEKTHVSSKKRVQEDKKKMIPEIIFVQGIGDTKEMVYWWILGNFQEEISEDSEIIMKPIEKPIFIPSCTAPVDPESYFDVDSIPTLNDITPAMRAEYKKRKMEIPEPEPQAEPDIILERQQTSEPEGVDDVNNKILSSLEERILEDPLNFEEICCVRQQQKRIPGKNITMLIILESGFQVSTITFGDPETDYTIQQLLDATPFACSRDPVVTICKDSAIDYICNYNDGQNIIAEMHDDTEKQSSNSEIYDSVTETSQSTKYVSELHTSLPSTSQQQILKASSVISLDSYSTSQGNSRKSRRTKKEPVYIRGYIAKCPYCRYHSSDFSRCFHCKNDLPEEVERVSACGVSFMDTETKATSNVTRRQETKVKPTTAHSKESTMILYPWPSIASSILVRECDFDCLEPGIFLNDTIIMFYIMYLLREVISKTDCERTYAFSTYLFSKLQDKTLGNAAARHKSVKRWTNKINIFEKDFIIIPINRSKHWFLAIVCFLPVLNSASCPESNRPCMLLFDSLYFGRKNDVIQSLKEYLHHEYIEKYGKENPAILQMYAEFVEVPQQKNLTDCGVYLLQYVESFFTNPISDFSPPITSLTTWFEEDAIKAKRHQIQSLIKKLKDEQKEEEY